MPVTTSAICCRRALRNDGEREDRRAYGGGWDVLRGGSAKCMLVDDAAIERVIPESNRLGLDPVG